MRYIWVIRYWIYKLLYRKISGNGYMGFPSFSKGLNKLNIKGNFGIFPGWRIEIIDGSVFIGNNVRIGNNLLLNCGSQIKIGDNVVISANVFIGTTDYIINNNNEHSFHSWKILEKPITIEDNCFIGFGAVILPGSILGKGSVVGANTVVKGTYPAGSVIAGEKSKTIRIRQ